MAKGRQQYFADEVSIQKEAREFAIEEALKEKIDSVEEGAQVNVIETVKVNGDPLIPDAEKAVDVSVPLVEDTLYSVDTEAALSARQGKVLYDYILNLQSRGRYLSNWNCATGLPTTNPYDSPYEYRPGDYYLVSNVSSGTNYRPDGSEYVTGVASTTQETEEVKVSDMYIYDGTAWQLILNTERPIAIDDALSPTSTNPVENRVVTQAIGTKQNIITDLQTIREGAAKGATAVQPGDSLSTLSGDSDDIAEGSSHLFMTTSERTKLGNQSGVNTGDETNATIKAKLGTASASTDGYLTSTDWNTFNDKQDAISDLETIRSNASAGKNASDTIATYGDIVTHNVSEFATAAQGALADSALQSGDNVSELVNDAGYITAAYHDDTKQDVLTAGDNVTIENVCHNDMQGPCPDGYHIPAYAERRALNSLGTTFGIWDMHTGPEVVSSYFKMPRGGSRDRWAGNVFSNYSAYWGCTSTSDREAAGLVLSSIISPNGTHKTCGLSIRPFKDTPVAPDGTWTTIYDGSSVATGAGIFRNEAEEIISFSSDGTTRYTLADKNLGATVIYNYGDAFTDDNCGSLFQRGNNHPFPRTGSIAKSGDRVDVSSYGPGNYYSSNVYIARNDGQRDEPANWNLWGGVTQGTRCQEVISATDTTYVASDFDIKDLADSTGLRTTWSGKQDALDLGANLSWGQDGKLNATDTTYTAGDGIEITQNNVIRNTRTSAEWGNITGTLSNQTDLQAALDDKQDELAAGDNITIGEVCESDMKGPCPSGFHIPTRAQWKTVNDIMSGLSFSGNGDARRIYLHMPFTGARSNSNTNIDSQGYRGQYWMSDKGGLTSPVVSPRLRIYSYAVYYSDSDVRARANAIRAFKNTSVAPDNTWTTIYDGSSVAAGAGIFHNATEGLISLSSDGTNWVTIADKNVGATTIYSDGDTLTQDNMGNFYQRGNNYGFPTVGTISNTSSTQVDASTYGPGNYYNSSTFIIGNEDWSSVRNDNLWGGVTQGQQCALEISAQVPDSAEWGNITGTLSNQTDLQNALDGKVNLGDNKVYDNTVVEIGKWVHGESADVSGHHVTLDPNGEVSTYNVTVAGHNEATLGSGNLTLLENTALGGDETTVISQDGITITEGQTTKTYNFLGNDRIATLSDVSGATSGAVSDAAYDNTWDGVTTVAPSKNAVYDKLEADLNTKTFYIRGDGSAEDLQRAQAAWDWILAGKNALLIDYDKRVYTLTQSTSSYAMFYCDRGGITYYNSNAMIDGSYYIRFSLSSGTVTSIGGGGGYSVNVLQTDVDYSTPYTPLYNGSPATKKYVDDAISGAGYTAGDGISIDANNEISNTLPGPTIAATAPTGTEGALWYDTTNNVLMAHDGTAWKEAGTQMKVLSYGHNTWQDFLDAYNENAIVYCRASSNSNPGSGTQGRMAFMAFVTFSGTTPTSVEFQYYRSRSDHNSQANQLDQVFVYTLSSNNGGTWSVTERNTAAKAVAGTGISLTYGSGNMTIANTGVTSFNGDTGAVTLSAGTYTTLSNNVIDVDTSLIATKADLANFAGFLVVAQLPTTDIKTNIIYLLGPVGTGADKYEEYIYSNNNWIMIGDTTIDLSPYFHKTNDDSDDIIEGSTNLFLTSAERTLLGNTSGTNSGDETKTTIQTKLGAASSSNSGYLTSADYDTFNGKADAADVNTKLFRLESNQDLTTAQAAYDWRAAGKNPIITHGNGGMMRTLYSASTTRLEFVAEGYYSNGAVTPNGNISEKGLYMTYINANSSGVVTSVSAGEKDYIRYLNTNVNYPTPYIPQYDGSPATKKYVDDTVAGISGDVKIVHLSGTTGATALAEMQEAYDWIMDGKDALLYYDREVYIPRDWSSSEIRWYSTKVKFDSNSNNALYQQLIQCSVSSGDVTGITLRSVYDSRITYVADMNYSDFARWTSTESNVPLHLATQKTPTANFTVTAPSDIKDGQTYILRVYNGATPYTMTLGTGITNPYSVDTTLTASGIDQFIFLAVGGNLELQPEATGGGSAGAITSNTTGTTTSISQIWVGTEAEYQALGTYEEGIAYMTF